MDEKEQKLDADFQKNVDYLNETLAVNTNYDIVYRIMKMGGKKTECKNFCNILLQ